MEVPVASRLYGPGRNARPHREAENSIEEGPNKGRCLRRGRWIHTRISRMRQHHRIPDRRAQGHEQGSLANAEAAEDGYKVLAVCPDHPQTARIKWNADLASFNDALGSAQQKEIPTKHQPAPSKAQDYSSVMHMCKESIRAQISSKNGERFSQQAAQYAVDNLQADYNVNALAKQGDHAHELGSHPGAAHQSVRREVHT